MAKLAFSLCSEYRQSPETFSIAYERDTPGKLSASVEAAVEKELLRELDQSFLDGNGDCLRAVARTQLDRDFFDLALDRSLAPMDLTGDLSIGRTVRNPRKHVDFIL